jgi:hypothetical protein
MVTNSPVLQNIAIPTCYPNQGHLSLLNSSDLQVLDSQTTKHDALKVVLKANYVYDL